MKIIITLVFAGIALLFSSSVFASEEIIVKLNWTSGSSRVDLDLYVENPDGDIVYYGNRTSDWGAEHVRDDQGESNASSYESFTINIDEMDCYATGKYTFYISHYTGPDVTSTITAEINGQAISGSPWTYTTTDNDYKETVHYSANQARCFSSTEEENIDTSPNLSSTNYTSNNPFYPTYNGQCTWFAWGRVKENLDINISTTGNAKTWFINTSLPKGNVPLPDSLAIWNNDRQGSSSNAGHVAYVEYFDTENIYYNEANVSTYSNGGGYDGSVKTSSMKSFEDRGNSIGKLSGFIYPAIELKDWWVKNSSISAGDNWDAQFKVLNKSRSDLNIEDSRVAIYHRSGLYLTSVQPANTGANLLQNETYHHEFSQVVIDSSGQYYAQPEILVNGQWIVLGSMQSFQVN